jgi:Raf kinase inhibitor-like YbhB/YbcL family protein
LKGRCPCRVRYRLCTGVPLRTAVRRFAAIPFVLLFLAAGCVERLDPRPDRDLPPTLVVQSPSFAEGGRLPGSAVCEREGGEGVSPAVNVSNIPREARVLAFVLDDATNGVVLWRVWNWGVHEPHVPEGADVAAHGAVEGANDVGGNGYAPPCPSEGVVHQYRFRAYALEERLDLAAGAGGAAMDSAMRGRILAWGEIGAVYG